MNAENEPRNIFQHVPPHAEQANRCSSQIRKITTDNGCYKNSNSTRAAHTFKEEIEALPGPLKESLMF